MSTEDDNNRYRKALESYKRDRERINDIKERYKINSLIPQNSFETIKNDIEWLCEIANDGINNKESSWYDHG